MVSNRIKKISSLLNSNDIVLDIGTDHALLPIYLIKNNIVNVADGSDISKSVLDNAKKNVSKYDLDGDINLFLSDGTKDIDVSKYNAFVITGMGFTTIKGILDNTNLDNINKLVIQSNNNLNDLRIYMNKMSYKILDEICLKDKDINYDIIVYVKGPEKLSKQEYICGKYKKENKWFYQENLDKLNSIINKIANKEKIEELNKIISYYKDYISK